MCGVGWVGGRGGRLATLLAVVGFKQVGLQSGCNTMVDRKCLISRGIRNSRQMGAGGGSGGGGWWLRTAR